MGSNLVLGTAQFGLRYGIANRTGRVADHEIAGILQAARAAGVRLLDTAVAYGDSEARIGELGRGSWDVITKLPPIPEECSDPRRWVRQHVLGSLGRLRCKSLYALLLHRSSDLATRHGEAVYAELAQLKARGHVRRVGVSIYEPSELAVVLKRHRLDLVQAPFNVIDRRLETSGWLARLREQNIEVHVRSIFLQGLLLMPADDRPQYFRRWNTLWQRWDSWLCRSGTNALHACLAFAMARTEVSGVVVGVDSTKQLAQVASAARATVPSPPDELMSNDVDLVNPSRWNVP